MSVDALGRIPIQVDYRGLAEVCLGDCLRWPRFGRAAVHMGSRHLASYCLEGLGTVFMARGAGLVWAGESSIGCRTGRAVRCTAEP